jgi:hypothetical protein
MKGTNHSIDKKQQKKKLESIGCALMDSQFSSHGFKSITGMQKMTKYYRKRRFRALVVPQ